MGLLEGKEVHIWHAMPGDEVKVQLTRVRPSQLEGKLLTLERPSLKRVAPRCSHFGPCGGCHLQHMDYPTQVQWKVETLRTILRTEGGLKNLPPIRAIPMEDPWGYRSKMEFSFGQQGDRILLGLHERGSFNRIIDIHRCWIAPPAISELLTAIREVANRFSLRAYDPRTHQGFWRYAVVRASQASTRLMLLVVTNEGPREPLQALAKELPSQVPQLASLWWGVSTKVSDVASPERLTLLWGSEVLEDQVGELTFQIRPMNFVQPNFLLTGRIYEEIASSADLTGKEAVYDLYCGIGLIALSLAKRAKVVYGVESDPENVAFAERNAENNGISNALFLCGKVEDLLLRRALFKAGPPPDLVILDPPRAGLHQKVYAPLLASGSPALMYLSCNPTTLAKDLGALLSRDPRYRLVNLTLFDFFPHTTHMEVLATLRRW